MCVCVCVCVCRALACSSCVVVLTFFSLDFNVCIVAGQAPEQFHQEYSYQIDVWAFGVTLCRLFSLKWPYPPDIGLNDLILAVGTGVLRPNFLEEDDVPDPDVLNVVNQCLLFDPLKRPTFVEIVNRLGVSLDNCQVRATDQQELALRAGEKEQELRSFLDRNNLGSFYKKITDKGFHCKASLVQLDMKTLTKMGLSKIKARRLLRVVVKEVYIDDLKAKQNIPGTCTNK